MISVFCLNIGCDHVNCQQYKKYLIKRIDGLILSQVLIPRLILYVKRRKVFLTCLISVTHLSRLIYMWMCYVVDTYSPDSPLMIMGDFNVSLPKALHLSSGWYKSRPYNRHSVLLYDFICNNELIVANFEFDQKVDYTYRKSNCSSYIDHCLVTRQLTNMVKECRILLEDQDSTSYHLPVWILI